MSADIDIEGQRSVDQDSSDSLRIAAPYDSDPALMVSVEGLNDRAFLDELRKRNLPMLVRTVAVFNLLYLGWGLFDYALAPDF
jgi:hypothetical protein